MDQAGQGRKRLPRNRVVEESQLPQSSVKVYHSSDLGDWRYLIFDLPHPLSEAMKEKAYKQLGEAWVQKCAKMGFKINRKSILPLLGPAPCLELDKLDRRTYCIAARFWVDRPIEVTAETARAYLETEPVKPSPPIEINQQAERAPHLIEANARAQADAAKKVPEIQAARKEIAAIRRQKGLKPFNPETVLEKHGLTKTK